MLKQTLEERAHIRSGVALKSHKAEMEIKGESMEMKKEIAKLHADAQTRQMEGFTRVMERIVDLLDHNAGKAHAAVAGVMLRRGRGQRGRSERRKTSLL